MQGVQDRPGLLLPNCLPLLGGVHLISVSKVTVRFPSNGAGMGR